MLQTMLDFASGLLGILADFLGTEPILELLGLVVFGYLVRCFLSFRKF